jgi:hypothetical protein
LPHYTKVLNTITQKALYNLPFTPEISTTIGFSFHGGGALETCCNGVLRQTGCR